MKNFYLSTKRPRTRHEQHSFRMWKWGTLLLTVLLLQVHAKVIAQKVTLHAEQAPLGKIFRDIRLQTGYDFLADNSLLEKAGPVTFDASNAELTAVLDKLLPPSLTYLIVSKTVIIKQRTSASNDQRPPRLEYPVYKSEINGKVTDTKGQVLIGASVALHGTSFKTATDNNGEFHFSQALLSSVRPGGYTLVITYIGYDKLERAVTLDDKSISIVITLHPSTSALDQVQVIAYGTESKRFSVGSVVTVSADEINQQPVTNPLLALQGRAPGLAVTATSGVPGSSVLVQIRGQNTLASAANSIKPYDQPLFIVDGVPFAAQNVNLNQLFSLASTSGYTGGISQPGGISPFNNINPNDIESVSILKDADATSIYGTQGSNGVIIITTKRGKPGKSTVNLSVNSGINTSAGKVKLMNTQQYLRLREDAFAADNTTPSNDPNDDGYAPDLTIFDKNKYTDWQKVIYGKSSHNTDAHASISGGSINNTFLLSGGYTRSDFNFPGSYADQRYSLHSSLHHTSLNNRFSLDFLSDFGYEKNSSPAFGGQTLLTPNTPDLLDAHGNLIWNYNGVDLEDYQFYAYQKEFTQLQNYNMNEALHFSYKIIEGLSFSANLGYNRNTTSEHAESPLASLNPINPPVRIASFAQSTLQSINIEPQLDYSKTIGKSMLSALVGATYKKNDSYSTNMQGYGYANDGLLGSINGATRINTSDGSSIYKYSAGFARLKYVYAQRYILSVTGRRDGSSLFGPGRQFGNFGSVGAGWIFSEEKGFRKALDFISYAKLSGNYGTNGSDAVAAYRYQSFWEPIQYVGAFQETKPSTPVNLYNPDFSWALKKSLNVALDLGLFQNVLLLNATYYRNREGNQLAEYPLPIHTGFGNVVENLPANIQNKGWEFSVTSNHIKTEKFTWSTNFNISFNRNKLLAFPNLASSSYSTRYVIGEPVSIIFGYRYKGVNPTTGLFEFYDKNGQPTSSPIYGLPVNGGDLTQVANQEIKYMGAIGNNLSYRHFTLSFFFQFSNQQAPNYLAVLYGQNPLGIGTHNVPTAVIGKYWQKPGDNTPLQRLSATYNSDALTSAADFIQSDAVYTRDIYLRLKTVALSYTLPEPLLKRLHLQNGSIYANAQNLLTFTNYKVGDPEQIDYSAFPLQRTVVVGFNLNF